MDDYMPNSNRFKNEQKALPPAQPEKKDIKPVVTGKVTAKKKSGASKLKDVFIADDAANIKSYVIEDVLIPYAKKAIVDIVKNSIDMLVYGASGRSNSSNLPHVSYDRFSDKNNRPVTTRTTSGFAFDDITLESRGDAELVLDSMCGIIEQYGVVSVADMYDLLHMTSDYTAQRYGWTNLRNACVDRAYGGYKLRLPKAMPINHIK